jgi:hypothetical protein
VVVGGQGAGGKKYHFTFEDELFLEAAFRGVADLKGRANNRFQVFTVEGRFFAGFAEEPD